VPWVDIQRHSQNLAGVALKVVTMVKLYHRVFSKVGILVSMLIHVVHKWL
jgi:hypothetical protein